MTPFKVYLKVCRSSMQLIFLSKIFIQSFWSETEESTKHFYLCRFPFLEALTCNSLKLCCWRNWLHFEISYNQIPVTVFSLLLILV